jgi:hypothetical protein
MDKPSALKAPLFRLLVERLEAGGRHVILDLGGASTQTLSLLGRFRCRVDITDLASDGGIERLNAEEPGDALVAAAQSLLPKQRAKDDAFDLVLCWDLPNYLKPPAMSALMAAIAARARPDALAHALIVYSERSMPARPGRFVPDEELKLVNRVGPVGEIKAPRYSPEDLKRNMGRFVIDRAMLLANGMQEFLFRLKS